MKTQYSMPFSIPLSSLSSSSSSSIPFYFPTFQRMANSSFTATIPPPHRLLRPLHVNEKKLFGPGPSNVPPMVQEGLMQPLLGHMHPEFFEIMDDVKMGLQYVFQTANPLTFAVSGTGHAGMECALMNLLEKGETILVVQNGVWGQRAASLAERLGFIVRKLVVPEGQVINLDDFSEVFGPLFINIYFYFYF
jgi:alanine-glyoxylate transaminase/serine-glyoxylate transaminase/serine-pyruvate transaminase